MGKGKKIVGKKAKASSVTDAPVNESSLGALCEAVAWANIQIYDLENKKWWSRKSGEATSEEIDNWDEISRAWNERRSLFKRKTDELLRKRLDEKKPAAPKALPVIPFQVLPISLMMDMMTIECIKVYDLEKKGNQQGVEMATARKQALKQQIDQSLDYIVQVGAYDLKGEARTF